MDFDPVAEIVGDLEEAFKLLGFRNAAAVQTALVWPSPPILRFNAFTSPLESSK